jgi:hypothetical protein
MPGFAVVFRVWNYRKLALISLYDDGLRMEASLLRRRLSLPPASSIPHPLVSIVSSPFTR